VEKFSTPDVDKKRRRQKAKFSTPDVDKKRRRQKSKFSAPDVDKMRQRTPRQEGGGKQTAYGIFAQACWAQYDDEAEIEEFNIQSSDWWEAKDLAEKEKEKFETLADRSKGPNADEKPAGAGEKSKDGILVSSLPTTTVRSLSPSHKIYRIGAGCSAAEHQTSTTLLLLPPTIPTTTVLLSRHSHKLYRTGCNSGPEQNQTSTVLFCRQQHEATLDAGEKSGNFSTLYADENSGSVSTPREATQVHAQVGLPAYAL
jgi:hypothetical protein